MTVTDQIKILDNKIKSNQEQHDLGREANKISAQSSKTLLEEYEYLTGEDLGYKPNVFEKAKFEYSPDIVDIVKISYSTVPKYRRCVKGYGFLSFARKFGDKYDKK